jgi:dipeptidyl-peptidase-4
MANSGVADWRLYDTIYTERYMSTLEDNSSGYAQGSSSRTRRSFRVSC